MKSPNPIDNPLSEPQRESAGSDSYDRFEYQYHWALCEALNSYSLKSEFAVFMEYHEDVIYADSLDKNTVRFSLSQIKANNDNTKYTSHNLTKREKSKTEGYKSSLLGKLCSSAYGKSFFNRVDSLNFVSTSGFSFKLKGNLKLNHLKVRHLDSEDEKKITSKLREEIIDFDKFPVDIINFIKSDVPLTNYYQHTIYKITDSVNKLYPDHYLGAISIYRVLMDTLRIKGKVNFDYEKWDEALNSKAVTSNDIHKVVTLNISGKSSDTILTSAKYILESASISALQKIKIMKSLDHYNLSILAPTISIQKMRRVIRSLITENNQGEDIDISLNGITKIKESLPPDIKDMLQDEKAIIAAIIYEMAEVI